MGTMARQAGVPVGPPLRASSSKSTTAEQQRIDDLVREIGARRWLRLRGGAVVWGFGGFLIGALFWHAIGFWGFLSEVVLNGHEPRVSVVARAASPANLPNCTALALNRATGRTRSIPCAERMPLLEEAALGRQDLAFVAPSAVTSAEGN